MLSKRQTSKKKIRKWSWNFLNATSETWSVFLLHTHSLENASCSNSRCFWLGHPPERPGCTAVCTHEQGQRHTHRMKDSKQLSVGWTLRFLSDSSGRKMLSFVCASGPNKSLARNLWEAQTVGKECPPPPPFSLMGPCLGLNQSLDWLIVLGASWTWQADRTSLTPVLTCCSKSY